MSIRRAVAAPCFADDPADLVRLAVEAEEAGFDGFFLWDHITWADDGLGPAIVDPWAVLSVIAARTQRLVIGPMITPVPRRRPWVLARQTVTLDLLAGGRTVFGVGLGSPAHGDFGLFGDRADDRTRAAMLDEGLDVIAGLWSGEVTEFHGQHYNIGPVRFTPTPAQGGKIPVWVGGVLPSRAGMRRAARWDGAVPIRYRDHALVRPTADDVASVRDLVREVRGSIDGFDLVVSAEVADAPASVAEELPAYKRPARPGGSKLPVRPGPTGTNNCSGASGPDRQATAGRDRFEGGAADVTELEPETTLGRAAGSWPLVHAERAALAADLAGLTAEQWATPSLCTGLTVREVLAHLIAGASLNPVRWLAGVIRCRFDFDKQVAMRLAEQLGATPAETLDRFRSVVTSTTKPPVPTLAMLGETIVHAQDIRLPLGIGHDSPIETLTRVAAYYQGSDLPSSPSGGSAACAWPRPTGPSHRLRAARVRHHPGPDHGNGRARGVLRGTPGRRRRDPAGAQPDAVTRAPQCLRRGHASPR